MPSVSKMIVKEECKRRVDGWRMQEAGGGGCWGREIEREREGSLEVHISGLGERSLCQMLHRSRRTGTWVLRYREDLIDMEDSDVEAIGGDAADGQTISSEVFDVQATSTEALGWQLAI